ncbi:putative Lipid A core-O-antigen ligase [Magnetospirillum sp. LM-5]|uniref:O-antigen ligase family protein n=1 Tax=Magnetospirillum sp. LM-5 TaxID=2681466 RepID=UPI001384157F|nr:O-antigen ligase family protein [Magnetospirillum sp. LM-5]CAA7619383.1 putative Lipid A core-O-antigen ligase [Magnetospirillum sp. LM-5]
MTTTSPSRLLLFAAGLILPPLAVLAANGMAPLAGLLGVLALARLWSRRADPVAGWPVAALSILLFAWAALSALWSPVPLMALGSAARLGGMVVVGTAGILAARSLDRLERDGLMTGLMIGSLVAALILSVEYLTSNSLSGLLFEVRGMKPLPPGAKSQFNRGATILALAVWPLVGWLTERQGRKRGFIPLAVIGAVILAGDSLAAILAVLAGSVVYGIATWSPQWAARLVVVATAALVLALVTLAPRLPIPPASFTSLDWLPISAHHRLAVWQFSSTKAAEHPLLGWGMESSRVIPGAEERLDTQWITPAGIDKGSLTGTRLPLHPHNALLQIWLELGMVGVALILLLVGQATRDRRPANLACLTATLAVASVSYGIWQSWWVSALWIIAALCAPSSEGTSA